MEKTNKVENNSVINLAKGNIAEKDGNIFEALIAYNAVGGNLQVEAKENINAIFNQTISGASLAQKVRYYETESQKWIKLFEDWYQYMWKGDWFFCVYDFSTYEDEFNTLGIYSGTISLNILPGIKIVPKQEVLLLHKQIFDNWKMVASRPEKKEWVNLVYSHYSDQLNTSLQSLRITSGGGSFGYTISVQVDLVNDYNITIEDYSARFHYSFQAFNHKSSWNFWGEGIRLEQIATQKFYCDKAEFDKIYFSYIDVEDITDNLIPKISNIELELSGKYGDPVKCTGVPIVSVSELDSFLESL